MRHGQNYPFMYFPSAVCSIINSVHFVFFIISAVSDVVALTCTRDRRWALENRLVSKRQKED
jgi:hypothetical protein